MKSDESRKVDNSDESFFETKTGLRRSGALFYFSFLRQHFFLVLRVFISQSLSPFSFLFQWLPPLPSVCSALSVKNSPSYTASKSLMDIIFFFLSSLVLFFFRLLRTFLYCPFYFFFRPIASPLYGHFINVSSSYVVSSFLPLFVPSSFCNFLGLCSCASYKFLTHYWSARNREKKNQKHGGAFL